MSTSPACSQALRLPEILAPILEQLGDNEALFAALQVNRLWADEATTILWRDGPPIGSMGRISVERLQYYDNKIRRLRDPEIVGNWSSLQELRYPRLSELSTWTRGEEDEQRLLRYLRPSLRRISYYCQRPISDSVLTQIEARCPALRALVIGSLEKTSKYDLLRFLKAMPSLTDICLDRGLEDVELCIHLASRANLQKLSVQPPYWLSANTTTWTEDHIMKILANVTNPFPKLEYISWSSQGRAFHDLVPHLFGLKDLQLTLVDAYDDVLFAIASCINLATVTVTFEKESRLSAEGLLAIAENCPHLHTLILNGPYDAVDGRSITDDIIRQVATYLPAMTHLQIRRIRTDLTITALQHLGDLCRKLEACSLRGNFDLEQLWHPNLAPLFTQLKSLYLSWVPKNISRDRAVSIIDQLAPQVKLACGYAKNTYLEGDSYELY